MEYVYAAMLIHKAGGNVTEESVKKVLEAAGVKVDDARVKALIAALDGVNIDEAIEKAAVVAAPAASAAPASAEAPAEKKEEPKEEKKEEAAAGLGALFG
ncbi:50S ribosomal protein P1 [Candidatus Woesearchaeota archaeon]|jgi:large subunit ribosomal protein L12|nr:50S ribosomal protein P1 [Candidatus Woesearchaeota archaeon]MBT6518267.1 50S ribosomal protein P1 [Candidatus Woesearchaeota archaeon]MBT7367562.1 50S ribosomal protein P1 [Candidatus Woesearchaeota archaeon]